MYNTDAEQTQLYFANALPFGASASVLAFNRFSRAIARIGTRLFGLLWTNFFDDYPQLPIAKLGGYTHAWAERLMSLLGWNVSKSEKKAKPFALVFQALGVEVDLTQTLRGLVIVKKTSPAE